MGTVANIDHDKFPAQSDDVGKAVRVCFHYDSSHTLNGTIVRSDSEEPGVMIIKLEDDRHVLATECMYSFPRQTH